MIKQAASKHNLFFSSCLCFIFFFAAFSAYSQAQTIAITDGRSGQPLLVRIQHTSPVWKISDTKSGNSLYLGGTMHVMRKEDVAYLKPFDTAFSDAVILVLETNAEELQSPEMQQYLAENMVLPDNQTLADVLSEEAFRYIEQMCEEHGVPIEPISRLKPALATSIFEVTAIQDVGFLEKGVDARYEERAVSEQKKLEYLESIETQIDLVLNMGKGYESEYVIYSAKDMENAQSWLDEITAAWRSGKLDMLQQQVDELRTGFPSVYDDLLKKRNAAWMPKIVDYLATNEKEFILVGLLHLYGEDGLITQLENAGFSAEQLIW